MLPVPWFVTLKCCLQKERILYEQSAGGGGGELLPHSISAFIESWTLPFPEVKHCGGLPHVLGKEKRAHPCCRVSCFRCSFAKKPKLSFHFGWVSFHGSGYTCLKGPHKSLSDISGAIIYALLTCRCASFSFMINNVTGTIALYSTGHAK